MKQLVFATNNAHKLDEVRNIVGDTFDILSLEQIGCHDDIEETADTFEGNALIKAREAHNSEKNMDKVLSLMQGVSDRSARFRTVAALVIGNREYTFEGEIKGQILEERRGKGGFGYDPIFLPEGETLTFAEMSETQKNAISHRARAMKKLADFLLANS